MAAAAPVAPPPFAAVKRRVANAIRRGAPLFDAGNAVGCERVYLDCYSALLEPGESQACDSVRAVLSAQLRKMEEGQPEHNSWELRRGFDGIMTLVEGATAVAEADTVRSCDEARPRLSSSHALLKCSDPTCVSSFRSVSDVVAGGQSSGKVTWAGGEERAVFSGRVRNGLATGTPFASCRVQGQFPNCNPFSGFYVDCSCETGRLDFVDLVVKDVDAAQSLVSFRARFRPPAGSSPARVLIPFLAFDAPERMGRPVIWPDLQLAAISEIGFRVSEVGSFKLNIREVGVYRE